GATILKIASHSGGSIVGQAAECNGERARSGESARVASRNSAAVAGGGVAGNGHVLEGHSVRAGSRAAVDKGVDIHASAVLSVDNVAQPAVIATDDRALVNDEAHPNIRDTAA